LKDFTKAVAQELLDIGQKNRSNLLAWRGQFSPQLIECLLDAYCDSNSVILDPFSGSGTVLFEAAAKGLPAFGFEINPAAWCFSKLYEYSNIPSASREVFIAELRGKIEEEFPIILFSEEQLPTEILGEKVTRLGQSLSDTTKILCNALVVSLDIFNNKVTSDLVQSKFRGLAKLVRELPYSSQPIKADLRDARSLPLASESVDFAITSPPYINVFNYHQNYRKSVEVLGWDLLKVARSEIGSNRANRGNRYVTVVQYCIDISAALEEMGRVLKSGGRAVLILGYESKVLGVPFYNAEIVSSIATQSGLFEKVLHQKRVFKNRFGESIREDILNLRRSRLSADLISTIAIARDVARDALLSAATRATDENGHLLADTISRIPDIEGTPHFNSSSYSSYHTREHVMMVREKSNQRPSPSSPKLPTPHLDKLTALLENRSLPGKDKTRVKEAAKRYKQWITELEAVKPGSKGAVSQLVEATNRYKKFVELDLIFDSPGNFLYRQKGQLKLDNTILEEFLPQLLYRGLKLTNATFEFGPQKTFSGLSFGSSLSNPGKGGSPNLRTKDQDFVLGKRLYMMSSFDKDFRTAERVEAHLGYVCAECKTNLDKTMFQEAVATSRDLKIAIPSSQYFLICEFLDMTPVSITSTHIDDVLIVRKSKRMSSNVRQEYKSVKERKQHRAEYDRFLESAKYYPDVFQRMIDKVQRLVDETDPAVNIVLKRGHF
jgi:SAM-dependent methyltransferase